MKNDPQRNRCAAENWIDESEKRPWLLFECGQQT
jgi:hypothetical protein